MPNTRCVTAWPSVCRAWSNASRARRPLRPPSSQQPPSTPQAHAAATARPKACNTDAAPAQLHTTGCWGVTARDVWWADGVVESGARTGRRGWVSGDLLAAGYRH